MAKAAVALKTATVTKPTTTKPTTKLQKVLAAATKVAAVKKQVAEEQPHQSPAQERALRAWQTIRANYDGASKKEQAEIDERRHGAANKAWETRRTKAAQIEAEQAAIAAAALKAAKKATKTAKK